MRVVQTALALCLLSGFAVGCDRVRADSGSGPWTVFLGMRHAAFQVAGAPSVGVHAPAGFDHGAQLHLVVFLHGYNGCVSVLMNGGRPSCRPGDRPQQGWDLASHHDNAGTNTLLVIPQLAFMKRSGQPGCFGKPGCFRSFVQELLSRALASSPTNPRSLADIADITLVAHSAGFQTASAILRQGRVERLVRNVVLMDALYGGVEDFIRWFRTTPVKNPRLISIYLGDGKTYGKSLGLYRRLRRLAGPDNVARVCSGELADAIGEKRVVICAGRGAHGQVPENYLAEVLGALGLPMRKR